MKNRNVIRVGLLEALSRGDGLSTACTITVLVPEIIKEIYTHQQHTHGEDKQKFYRRQIKHSNVLEGIHEVVSSGVLEGNPRFTPWSVVKILLL